MFYDVFLNLCNNVNKSPSAVVLELGLAKASVTNWKKRGSTPTDANLQKIADYFNVSVNYLLEKEEIKEEKTSPAAVTEDDELNIYLEELKNRKEMRMLFKLASGATKEDVEKAVAIIEALSR